MTDNIQTAYMAVGGSGTLLWRASYSPFGEKTSNPSANRNDVGYTGHVQDGLFTNLTYMQARFYDPSIGRFLSTDPIGYQDQLNLFAYVHNDPVNNIDPTGLCTGSLIKSSSFCAGAEEAERQRQNHHQ